MSIAHRSSTRTTNGFTIVELLIVIVVIGILAAITIVAYNGIQARAENTKTTQAVAEYAKALQSYKAINGVYPPVASAACIGGVSTTCGNITDTTSACFAVPQIQGSSSLDSALGTIISNLPQPSTQQVPCSSGQSYAGAFYDNYSTARLIWYLKGTLTCTDIAGMSGVGTQQSGSVTQCVGSLPQ